MPTEYGIPIIGQRGLQQSVDWAYCAWEQIKVSSDASSETIFRFPSTVTIQSNKEYAIVVKYDGNEDFILWYSTIGEPLISGPNIGKPAPGPNGRYIGKMFTYISPSYSNTASANTIATSQSEQQNGTTQYSQSYLLSAWKPLDNKDLKFIVSVARYFVNGDPVFSNTSAEVYNHSNNITKISNNHLQITLQSIPVEYVTFDNDTSSVENIMFGDLAYQDQPYYSGGKTTAATCKIQAGNNIILANTSFTVANGSTFNWNMIFANSATVPQNIVVTSLNHDGANLHQVDIRKVISINTTSLVVDKELTITNTAAKFFAAPVGRISSRGRTFGLTNGSLEDIITLTDSNANSTCRFTNNTITDYTIVANGTGYSNSDYINITGFESVSNELYGGYSATANVLTNANGSITAVYITNAGCGFTNADAVAYSISNSSGGSTSGSAANLTFTIDSIIKTEMSNSNTVFKGCKIINLDASQVVPIIDMPHPPGVTSEITHRSLYYKQTTANTLSGKAYYLYNTPSDTDVVLDDSALYNFSVNSVPSIVSRSNQFAIRYANGTAANASVIGADGVSNVVTFIVDVSSNNDFSMISFGNTYVSAVYDKYIINNDYTGEHTNYGNAWAKHVTSVINFANGRMAEDLVVYLTGHRPQGTDFKVYTRIHNKLDDDAFDDKDWTLLKQTDGVSVYSNPYNQSDMKEYTYSFPMYPNNTILTGTVATVLDQANVTGTGTGFSSNLVSGDVVKLYQPLFPNNYMISVVNSVTNNTLLTLEDNVANNGLVGSGLRICKVDYPHQAFHNQLNSNVVSYYNGDGVKFDTYDSFQLKVVFISNNDLIVPKLDDVRGIGVTA